jgi:hypothetical protein
MLDEIIEIHYSYLHIILLYTLYPDQHTTWQIFRMTANVVIKATDAYAIARKLDGVMNLLIGDIKVPVTTAKGTPAVNEIHMATSKNITAI